VRRQWAYVTVLMLLVGAWLICPTTVSQPLQAAPANGVPDPGQMGPYAIGHTSFVLYDTSRPGNREGESTYNGTSRPIPVSLWYPVDRAIVKGRPSDAVYPLDPLSSHAPTTYSDQWERYGIDPAFEGPIPSSDKPFPLVVFSPGGSAPTWLNTSTATRLASHGFVVAVMYHWGNGWWWGWEPWDPAAVAAYNRPRDMSFVLTDLLTRDAARGDLLYGLIRPDQVAAAGHSFGGYAAEVLAGGDDHVCDTMPDEWGEKPAWTCGPSSPDPRFKALALLSGFNDLLHFSELARVAVPTIGIGEEWNVVQDQQARQHAAFSGQPAYRVDLTGAVHMSFSDACEAAHVLEDIGWDENGDIWYFSQFCTPDIIPSGLAHQLTHKYMVAFLKTHLAGEPGYQSMLTPGWALTHEQYIEFFVTEKRNPNSIDEDWPGLFTYFPHQSGSVQARGVKDPVLKRAIPGLGPHQ